MTKVAAIALTLLVAGSAAASAQLTGASDTSKTVLFAYDFAAGPAATFHVQETESAYSSVRYAFDGFAIIAKRPFSGASRLPLAPVLPNPSTLEATGQVRDGVDAGASWGIAFGADSTGDSYFAFTVNANAEYQLFKRAPSSGHIQFVAPVAHVAIHKGLRVTNTLAVRVDGARVTLIANDTVLEALDVGIAPIGQAMLLRAGPDKEGKMVVVFFALRASVR